jgi:arginyl-tRNA--protein-N-Asp/Glu arginylyltransferase
MNTSKSTKKCLRNNTNTTNVETCPWTLNTGKYTCFWEYVYKESHVDGSMKEHTQTEISEILGLSNIKMPVLIKEALQELANSIDPGQIKDLLYNSDLDLRDYTLVEPALKMSSEE